MGCQPPEVSPAVPPVWVMPTPRPVPSVLVTTHYLEEAQALASRVVVLAGGPSSPRAAWTTSPPRSTSAGCTCAPRPCPSSRWAPRWRAATAPTPCTPPTPTSWSGRSRSRGGVHRAAFFQFGVGIAEQRATPWERYLRTLPLSGIQRLAGRVQVTCGKPPASFPAGQPRSPRYLPTPAVGGADLVGGARPGRLARGLAGPCGVSGGVRGPGRVGLPARRGRQLPLKAVWV
jgi:hypothetical protein